MPTATSERIRARQERLDARTQEFLDTSRQHLLKYGDDVLAVQREAERDLRGLLREGVERGAFLGVVTAMRPHAERAVELLGLGLAHFKGDAVLESRLCEVQGFLNWLRSLEESASGSFPPLEESQLLPPPTGATAEGYISASEARARVRSAKKP